MMIKSVFFKKVLGKIASSINLQKLPCWNEINMAVFCKFLDDAIFPSTFLKKTDFIKWVDFPIPIRSRPPVLVRSVSVLFHDALMSVDHYFGFFQKFKPTCELIKRCGLFTYLYMHNVPVVEKNHREWFTIILKAEFLLK